MTEFEKQIIINKFVNEVILNSPLEDITDKDRERIQQFLLSALAQQREEIVKEIRELFKHIFVTTDVYLVQRFLNKLDSLTSSVPEKKEGWKIVLGSVAFYEMKGREKWGMKNKLVAQVKGTEKKG